MNRMQKKCFIASVGLHLLLPLIFLVTSGFLSRPKPDNTPMIDFIPVATVDQALSGGGDNTVKSPPAALVEPPATVTPPAPVVDRTAPPPLQRETPRDKPEEADVTPIEPNSHKVKISTTQIVRNSADLQAARDAARAKEAAERRREANAFGQAIAGIKGGVSGSTEVKLQGPGGGGVPYGNFLAAVRKVYWDNWLVPDGSPDVTVKAVVTIAKDGSVVSTRVVHLSGNDAVDNSVQMTLDRVKYVAPLPQDATEDQRTVPINFDTESKLSG